MKLAAISGAIETDEAVAVDLGCDVLCLLIMGTGNEAYPYAAPVSGLAKSVVVHRGCDILND